MKQRFRDNLVPVAIVISLFAVCTAATAKDDEPQTIEQFRVAFVEAVRAMDADRWAALVTDDVVMMAPNGRMVEGRPAFKALWQRSFEGQSGPNPLSVKIDDVLQKDALAIVRAQYGPKGRDPVGQYVWVLVREAKEWRLAWWIFNRQQAPQG
jgi:ketosteroid isomerase-like protein